MFEGLTKHLPELERAESYGDWVVDHKSKGTMDDPIKMPYVNYSRVVIEVEQAIYAFVDEHPEYELTRYSDILEHNGLEWGGYVMSRVDVSQLDGQAVMALLLGAVRADRFCEGALLGFFEDGSVRRWLLRLRELDDGAAPPSQIGFWKEGEYLGCCSNWYPTGFGFRGVHFSTGEHWMMWQKACLMGDREKAEQILAAPTPRRAKELGGQVKPYSGALWDAVREQLVYYGVREKFLANKPERNLLLSTGSALLAEASPYDKVWGVGMTADDPRFSNPAKWDGENLLGRACMR